MKLIFSVLDRTDLWPHFRAHYQTQGITQFLCITYGPQLDGAIMIPASIPKQSFTGVNDATQHNRVLQQFVSPNEWCAIADLDEFSIVDEGNSTLVDACRQAQADGCNVISGVMQDRLTKDGHFPAHLEADIWTQFPLQLDITNRVLGGCKDKVVCLKGWVRVGGGHHYPIKADTVFPWHIKATVHHFKWWGANPTQFFTHRINEGKGQWYTNELQRLATHLEQHDGHIDTSIEQDNV